MSDLLTRYGSSLWIKILEHVSLSLGALLIASFVAVFLGIILSRNKKMAQFVISITSLLQTIPSLALLAMMVPYFGVGKIPALVALVVYALLPILRNTVLGMQGVDPSVVDAAKGMGLNSFQQIFRVQIPLAMGVILAGIRLAGTYVLSWATLASYIGAGGLGDFIFAGLNNYNIGLIVLGTIFITLLTFLLDGVFMYLDKKLQLNAMKKGDI